MLILTSVDLIRHFMYATNDRVRSPELQKLTLEPRYEINRQRVFFSRLWRPSCRIFRQPVKGMKRLEISVIVKCKYFR
jgi:hypothetical protein